MVRYDKAVRGCLYATLCLAGSAPMAVAAPTYYTDNTGWNYGTQQTANTYSNNYTASYNMGTNQAPRQRSSSSKSKQVQPNTYADTSGYDGTQQASTASSWSPSPNTYNNGYSQEAYNQATTNEYGQWNSSYQQQPQTSKRRGIISRMFNRDSNVTNVSNVAPRSYPGSGVLSGNASWYGRDFHGGKTANGERYDMNSMTAAHRTLPFGTLVKVTNENNGRECVVRINNRGPYLKGRVIDLSKAAASQLGMVSRGVCRVSMQVLGQ